MNQRQHAMAAANAVGDEGARSVLIEAMELEIALAVEEERNRCLKIVDIVAVSYGVLAGVSPFKMCMEIGKQIRKETDGVF